MRVAVVVLAVALINTPTQARACVSPDYPKGRTVKVIQLPKVPSSPYYYVRTFDFGYVMMSNYAFERTAMRQRNHRRDRAAAQRER